MGSSGSNLTKRWAPLALLGFLAACGAGSDGLPTDPARPGAEDARLQAQHQANLAMIGKYRRESEAKYDSLVAVWKTHNEGDGRLARASGQPEPFVACAPLPFDAEAQIVGTAGGSFNFGPHRLDVPAGALSGPVSIGVMVPSALKSEVVLVPHGLRFAKPVILTLAYGHCDSASSPRVAYIDDVDTILDWVSSANKALVKVLEVPLAHFSKYAVAY